MKKIFGITPVLIVLLLSTAQAQFTYPNEVCSGAIQLNVSNNSRLYDTLWLDDEFADPNFNSIPYCNGATNVVRRDLWYRFIATDTAISLLTMYYPATAGQVYYQLFTGDCGNLVSASCYNLNSTLGGLSIGQQYYLRSFYPSGIGNDFSNFTVNLVSKPTNDDCAGSITLPVFDASSYHSLGERFTNALATRTTTAACNAPAAGWSTSIKDVWYKFIATAGSHAVYIQSSSTESEAIVYREAAGVFTQVGVFNFYESSETLSLTNLVPGSTYYIRFGAVANVNFTIGVFANNLPNDHCINADTVFMSTSFACENNFTVGSRIAATNSTGGCGNINKDRWYIFQATSTNVTIRATEAANVNMGLLQGSCGTLTCLKFSSQSTLYQAGLTVGNYYYLQVGGFYEPSPITICISPSITNDECIGAIDIAVKPYGQNRTNLVYTGNATQSMPRCTGSGSALDVWYRFTATDTAHIINIAGTDRFQVLSGTCGALTPLYCGGAVAQPLYSIDRNEKVAGLLPGNAYFLRVYNDNSGSGTLFTIDVNEMPANDECAGATLLAPQQSLDYEPILNNGILQASQSLAPCSTGVYKNDIWYKFVAPAGSATVISHMANAIGNLSTLGMELYNGSCGSLVSLACIQQGETVAHRARNFSNLVAGDTYYLRQYGNVTANTISIITPPANDDITGAIRVYPSPAALQPISSYSCHAASKKFGKICASSNVTMEHDTWFYFVAEAAAHTVTTSNTNSFWNEQATASYRLEAFRGFAPDSISLVPKLITCATNSLALSNLVIGDTVYIRVGAMAVGLTNIFTIKVSNTSSIDEPAGAALITKKNVYEYKISTTGATQSMPAGGCLIADFPDDDVWFKFNAAADVTRIVAGLESLDITLQLFSGTPGNLTPVLCSNNIMILPPSLTTGSLYYLRAYTKVNTTRGDFQIGLFGDQDLYANTCSQPAATLGPNLVKNARFELEEPYVTPNISSGYGLGGKKLANGWWGASIATPDAWSGDYPVGGLGNTPAASGYAKNKIPRSGKGMLGILNTGGWHEYVTGALTKPLTKGKMYFVSFYISFAEDNANEAFKIGALLSNDSIHNYIGTETLNITPQVGIVPGSRIDAKTKWYNVCGYMTADKAHSFITIGNFGEPEIYGGTVLNTYMFIEDVVVAEVINQVLPLTLLEFRGRTNTQQHSELDWITTSETNSSRFEIEWRSQNTGFIRVGTVAAAGNSSTNQYYRFLHTSPGAGYNYYRLKMYDTDGQFTYSSIVRTGGANTGNTLAVFPNPVADVLNITTSVEREEMVLFKLVDSYGRVVAARQKLLQTGSNAFSWDISALAAGNYFMVSTYYGHKTVKLVKR